MTELDIDFVRAQFPAFSQPSLQGHAFLKMRVDPLHAVRLLTGCIAFIPNARYNPMDFLKHLRMVVMRWTRRAPGLRRL